MRMLYLRFVTSGAGGFSSDMHSSSLTGLWHFLPEASGKICQGFLAKNRRSTRDKNHQPALDRGQNVAGSDPQSPEGFGRTEGPPNGVAPGHGCVFCRVILALPRKTHLLALQLISSHKG